MIQEVDGARSVWGSARAFDQARVQIDRNPQLSGGAPTPRDPTIQEALYDALKAQTLCFEQLDALDGRGQAKNAETAGEPELGVEALARRVSENASSLVGALKTLTNRIGRL